MITGIDRGIRMTTYRGNKLRKAGTHRTRNRNSDETFSIPHNGDYHVTREGSENPQHIRVLGGHMESEIVALMGDKKITLPSSPKEIMVTQNQIIAEGEVYYDTEQGHLGIYPKREANRRWLDTLRASLTNLPQPEDSRHPIDIDELYQPSSSISLTSSASSRISHGILQREEDKMLNEAIRLSEIQFLEDSQRRICQTEPPSFSQIVIIGDDDNNILVSPSPIVSTREEGKNVATHRKKRRRSARIAAKSDKEKRKERKKKRRKPKRCENKKAQKLGECVICKEEERCIVYVECGHVALCETCSAHMIQRELNECPLCRKRGPMQKLFFC